MAMCCKVGHWASPRIMWNLPEIFELLDFTFIRCSAYQFVQVLFLLVLVAEQGMGSPFIRIPPAIADMLTPAINLLQVQD